MPVNMDPQHLFVSGHISIGKTSESGKTGFLNGFKQLVGSAATNQLAVHNPASGQHVATGVTQVTLTALKQTDAATGGAKLDKSNAENILKGLGIDVRGMGAEMRIRLARVGVQDAGTAVALANLRGRLDAAALLDLVRMADQHGVASMGALAHLATAVGTGPIPADSFAELARIGVTNPGLAGKLATLLADAVNGGPGTLPVATVQYLIHTGVTDEVMADLTRPDSLPPLPALPGTAPPGFDAKLHIMLDPGTYQQMKTQYGTASGLVFDDAHHTVHAAFAYQQLKEIMPPLADAARDAAHAVLHSAAPVWAEVEKAFGDPAAVSARQDARINLVVDCHREWGSFDFNAFKAVVDSAVIAPGLTGLSTPQKIAHLLGAPPGLGFPGMCVSESHAEPDGKSFLINHMPDLQAQGVTTLYIEHLLAPYQPLVDQFLSSPPGTAMPPELQAFLDGSDATQGLTASAPNNLKGLLLAAKASGMRVVGLDDNNVSRRTPGTMAQRAMGVNRLGEQAIKADAAARGVGKYVILCGGAHSNTDPGLTNGIPGFSQLLKIPAVTFDMGTSELALDPENEGNRRA
jgi:hypothetical protein